MLEVLKFAGAAIGGIVAGLFLGKLFSKKELPEEFVIRVWIDEERKSKLIAREVVRWDGKGWSGNGNGFTVDFPLNVPAKEKPLCSPQESISSVGLA